MMKLSNRGAVQKSILLAALWLALALVWPAIGCAQGSAAAVDFAARYPLGSIDSVETADRALVDAAATRKAVLARYADAERICYPKFFASSCLDQAKEERRAGLAQLRPVEVEAGRFKRNIAAETRDKELQEKRLRAASEAPQHLIEQQQHDQAAARKLESQGKNAKSEAQLQQETERADHDDAARIARHDAKLKQSRAQDAANAGKRAENIAAFEKKQQDAKTRQEQAVAKRLEKERKAQQQAESERAAQAAAAAKRAAAAAASKP